MSATSYIEDTGGSPSLLELKYIMFSRFYIRNKLVSILKYLLSIISVLLMIASPNCSFPSELLEAFDAFATGVFSLVLVLILTSKCNSTDLLTYCSGKDDERDERGA